MSAFEARAALLQSGEHPVIRYDERETPMSETTANETEAPWTYSEERYKAIQASRGDAPASKAPAHQPDVQHEAAPTPSERVAAATECAPGTPNTVASISSMLGLFGDLLKPLSEEERAAAELKEAQRKQALVEGFLQHGISTDAVRKLVIELRERRRLLSHELQAAEATARALNKQHDAAVEELAAWETLQASLSSNRRGQEQQ